MGKKHLKTEEERIADYFIKLLADLRIDLDMIGLYFGKYARFSIFRRFEHIYEVAKEFRDNPDDREEHNEYIKNINN